MRRILLIVAGLFGVASMAMAAPPPIGPGDQVLGSPKAPVTVIEYASLTCPHCAKWEGEVFPQVKKDWIDTGKIRFVFRDFPLDGMALRAAVLAHCAGPERVMGFVEVLFSSQTSWARADDPMAELTKIGKLGGVSEPQFKACLADQALQNSISASRQSGTEAGVDSTPTFFINGKKTSGELPYDDFVKLLHDAGA